MLVIALVLALVGLAALVTAVVTGNTVIAWVCIAASVAGVVLLIVDAVRERFRKLALTAPAAAGAADSGTAVEFDADYPDEPEGYAEDYAADYPVGYAEDEPGTGADQRSDADADPRAVPFGERHDDEVGAEQPEEPRPANGSMSPAGPAPRRR